MAKDVNLLSYWMPVLKQLKEFKYLASAEEPELLYLLEACDSTLSNMFISTADVDGIARLERILGIYPEEGEELETRRFNVLVKWNDKAPYTDEELYNKLLSLCGSEDKFSIDPNYADYEIDITTEISINGAFDTLTNLLVEMLPCNLVLTLQNILTSEKSTPLYCGVGVSTSMKYEVTHDINKDYTSNIPLYAGVGLGNASTHTVTNDVAISDELEGSLVNGVGMSVAKSTLVTHDTDCEAELAGNATVGTPVSTATVITIN